MRFPIHVALSIAVLFLSMAACSSDEIATPLSSPNSSTPASIQSVERPWLGECDVDAEFISEFTLRIVGSCQLAHIGRATLLAYQTITPGELGISYTNTAIYTAPDGDELHTTNIGVAVPNSTGLSLSGTETAAGGTGRFANATGAAQLTGAIRFTSSTTTQGSYQLDGRLSF